MTQVKMPQPVAFLIDWPDEPDLGNYFAEEQAPTGRSRPLITTTQAEAYADARVAESQQWQPIETAPKDGTWIMAYRPPCEGVQMDTILMVSWQPFDDEGSAWMWPDAPYDLTTEAGRTAALRLIEQGSLYWDESFTHWMPLPAPPHQ